MADKHKDLLVMICGSESVTFMHEYLLNTRTKRLIYAICKWPKCLFALKTVALNSWLAHWLALPRPAFEPWRVHAQKNRWWPINLQPPCRSASAPARRLSKFILLKNLFLSSLCGLEFWLRSAVCQREYLTADFSGRKQNWKKKKNSSRTLLYLVWIEERLTYRGNTEHVINLDPIYLCFFHSLIDSNQDIHICQFNH